LSRSRLRLLLARFILFLPIFVMVMLAGSLIQEFVDFSLREFHDAYGGGGGWQSNLAIAHSDK
jgi:hypothetical protein